MNGSDGGGSFQHSSQVVSEPAPAPVRPAMDLGEKQAMEDRLRKKVLQSQKARAAGKLAPCGIQTSASESAPDSPILDPATTSTSVPRALSAVSSATQPPLPENSMPARSDASHANEERLFKMPRLGLRLLFSLEDLAVSFITQTIETYKSQPGTPTVPASVPMSLEAPSHSSTQLSRLQRQEANKLELAAKQRRLEQHIAESKALMARLTQARSKEEKDRILKIMKEKSWLFEEANKTAALSDDNMASSPSVIAQAKKTELNFNSVSSSGIGSRTSSHSSMTEKSTMMTQFQIARWPVSRHDAGVLILSDDEDEDDDGDDEDGAA
ncbi:hypothetical protein CPB84DRAFT_1783478 [Gymnopilus junonius]|uniref:Uncharacterized protein n=1 Tax=Gymnopilus junonius TaxID=109634 RepID=A0A9P5TLV8_GYMJU|nr:hypothetical protein CPB84DRAFT_1783478 [Gymnopilus junonius]